jgi:hypothetical protein
LNEKKIPNFDEDNLISIIHTSARNVAEAQSASEKNDVPNSGECHMINLSIMCLGRVFNRAVLDITQ